MFMARERKRVMGELAAWQVLAMRAYFMAEDVPPLDELNIYGDGAGAVANEALARIEAAHARIRLQALAGKDVIPETPESAMAKRIIERQRQEQQKNDERTQAAIARILNRTRRA